MPSTKDRREPSDPKLQEQLRADENVTLRAEGTGIAGATGGIQHIKELVTGEVFAGKYKILQRLGEGGMSVVYKAEDIALSRVVALKIMRPGRELGETGIRRFQQEARAASRLDHPNIVRVYEFGIQADGPPYLVLEYVAGRPIADDLAKHGPFTVDRLLNVMEQTCDALTHAHESGVVHRDLKPSNIMVVEQRGKESVRILDFGIAKLISPDGDAQKLTQTGEIFGSPLYMSPEQCLGKKLDQRADVYALGCVMYEALTGKPPISGDNAVETIYKHIQEEAIPLSKAAGGRESLKLIEPVVMRCLEKNPDDRYQSVVELKQDLARIGGGSKAKAKRKRRKPVSMLVWTGACVAFTAAMTLTCSVVFRGWEHQTQVSTAQSLPTAARPLDPGGLIKDGLLLERVHDYSGAISKYEEALREAPPKNAKMRSYILGHLCQSSMAGKDFESARRYAGSLLGLVGDEPEQKAYALWTMLKSSFEMKDNVSTKKYSAQLAQLLSTGNVRRADLYMHRSASIEAWVDFAEGNMTGAESKLLKEISYFKQKPGADPATEIRDLYLMTCVKLTLKQNDEARQYLEQEKEVAAKYPQYAAATRKAGLKAKAPDNPSQGTGDEVTISEP